MCNSTVSTDWTCHHHSQSVNTKTPQQAMQPKGKKRKNVHGHSAGQCWFGCTGRKGDPDQTFLVG